MDELFTFENALILLLVAIVFMLVLKVNQCGVENFDLKSDMELHESKHVLASKKFDLSCCDSEYTNDKGCLCGEDKVRELIKTRGYNNSGGYKLSV